MQAIISGIESVLGYLGNFVYTLGEAVVYISRSIKFIMHLAGLGDPGGVLMNPFFPTFLMPFAALVIAVCVLNILKEIL